MGLRESYQERIDIKYAALEDADKEYQNLNEIRRCSRAIELLDIGVFFTETHSGFMLGNGVIIAAVKNKYCYPTNRGKWYWFGKLEDLINKLGGAECLSI